MPDECSGFVHAKRESTHSPANDPFILGLTEEDGKDITLSEIAERLEAEHGEKVDRSTVWHWLARRGITVKKRPPTRPSRTARTSA